CDPYFGPDDLQVLQLVLRSAPHLKVAILTSRKQQQMNGAVDVEESYKKKWRSICDQQAPDTEIVVVGNSKGELPIHDRWWLTKGKGLRIGTSFNSLGAKKESEISGLTEAESRELELRVDEFIETRKREHNGEKLSVFVFSL
ncbi:MAG TPA: hypothetical protein VNK23_09415, partial [Candidatus Dormibacteraeota bacterium]|nr:hypothetical protein [Candidatus Dormibacteraeota bacterium]